MSKLMLCLENIPFFSFFQHYVDVPFIVRIFYGIIFRDCFYKREGRILKILKILFCLAWLQREIEFFFLFFFSDDISLTFQYVLYYISFNITKNNDNPFFFFYTLDYQLVDSFFVIKWYNTYSVRNCKVKVVGQSERKMKRGKGWVKMWVKTERHCARKWRDTLKEVKRLICSMLLGVR